MHVGACHLPFCLFFLASYTSLSFHVVSLAGVIWIELSFDALLIASFIPLSVGRASTLHGNY